MEITLNGETRVLERPMSVAKLLEELGLRPEVVVVERNEAILDRRTLDQVELAAGDRLEIIQMIAGG